jgi:hypothetical protein
MKMEAMKTFFLLLILLGLLGIPAVQAQQSGAPDSLKDQTVTTPPDSLNRVPLPRAISLMDTLMAQGDSLAPSIFKFSDLLRLNYQGLADVFRLEPRVQVFDFLEVGLPRFVSSLHLWPQQTVFALDHLPLNDPLSGMFNTRFIFTDALKSVRFASQNSPQGASPWPDRPGEIEGLSRIVNTKEPYTRIMYREGDFGYSDLDITFAQRLGRKTLLQLGGINRDYDPNGYRGTHYRGRMIYQLSSNSLASFTYRKSSENVSFFDRYGTQFGMFRYNEVWEKFDAQITHVNKRLKTDWLLRLFYDDSRRQYRFFTTEERLRLRFDRLRVLGAKQGRLGNVQWQMLAEAMQVKAWGSVYDRKYTDSQLKAQGLAFLTLKDSLRVTLRSALRSQWNQPLQVEPSLEVFLPARLFVVHLVAVRYARFPTVHERFFSYQKIQGFRFLNPEGHQFLTTDLARKFSPWFETRAGLTLHRIGDEIKFDGDTFYNGEDRQFSFGWVQTKVGWKKFELCAGGQLGLSGQLLGPENSGFAQIHYRDRWIHGHMQVDAVGTVRWYGARKNMAYQPYAERFYRLPGRSDGFFLLSYKIVATVKDAHLFMEMDNPLGTQYTIINGYPELYRRVRFGVSWVLWN